MKVQILPIILRIKYYNPEETINGKSMESQSYLKKHPFLCYQKIICALK